MSSSYDGGGSMGRDMATSEADNLWVGATPGGLTAQRATPARTLTAKTGARRGGKDARTRERPAAERQPFPRTDAKGLL